MARVHPSDFIAEFPERVRLLRERARWTQQELAEKAEISRPFIALIESGKRVPSVAVFGKLMDVLAKKVGLDAAAKGWWGPITNGQK